MNGGGNWRASNWLSIKTCYKNSILWQNLFENLRYGSLLNFGEVLLPSDIHRFIANICLEERLAVYNFRGGSSPNYPASLLQFYLEETGWRGFKGFPGELETGNKAVLYLIPFMLEGKVRQLTANHFIFEMFAISLVHFQ